MMKSIFISIFIFGISLTAQSQIQKKEKIDRLIEILGSQQQFESFLDQNFNVLLDKYKTNISDIQFAALKQESVSMINQFVKVDLPLIYDRYLTEEEVESLIEFYTSPVGERFRKMQPLISRDIQMTFTGNYLGRLKENMLTQLNK